MLDDLADKDPEVGLLELQELCQQQHRKGQADDGGGAREKAGEDSTL